MVFITATSVFAKDEVGTVVAVKNRMLIEREQKALEAKVKDSIQLLDRVQTLEASKAKLLFIDDSVLSLGEKTKVEIKEFIYSKEKAGKSIFNLIDGKMRSVVGKTNFEIHTPTAVAAARGTIILADVSVINGKNVVTFICLDGETFISKAGSDGKEGLLLKAGMKVTIVEGEPFPLAALPATNTEIEQMLLATDISIHEISIPGPMNIEIGAKWFTAGPPLLPQINQQPPQTKTPVTIDLVFP